MNARLAVLEGDARPNVVDLAPDRPISIGRSRDNTIVLPHDEQASRLHARVYFEGGRWLLRDFGLNGTRIEDSRVNQVAELADGNEIKIGGVRFKFQIPDPAKSSSAGRPPPDADRSRAGETAALSLSGLRWTVDELSALVQFLVAAAEAKDTTELSRAGVQTLFYQSGASLAGVFTLDPTNPLPKFIWPEAAKVDEHLARQLTRRMHRDHRLVWLAEDTVATIPNSGTASAMYADALALPLKIGQKVFGAIHLYKASGYFSDRDRKFADAVAGVTAPIWRGLRARRVLEAEVARLKGTQPDGDDMLGDSPTLVALRSSLVRAAANPRPVLFTGEAGAGKELAALAAHRRGPRADGPFVTVRCTSTPSSVLEPELFGYRKGAFSGAEREHPGLVALADDGTLFFDEVTDLSTDCQVKLMKLIETRSYKPLGASNDSRADVKIMAATRYDLGAEVEVGRFNSELFNALQATEVNVPSLREHPDDIPHLAQYFLDRIGAESRREWALTPEALRLLRALPWPGNVRQLKSVLGHAAAAVTGEVITDGDLKAILGNSQA
jgi:two-component system, NtrC family, response regulator HydG